MKRILFFLAIILSTSVFAQLEVNPEIELGLSFPQGNLTSEVYNQGISYSFGLNFLVWKELGLKPNFQYRFYKNKPDDLAKESLRIRSLSINMNYTFLTDKKIQLRPEVGIGRGSFRNILRVELPDGKEETGEMMKGDDLFYEIGFYLNYKKVYLKFSHQWFTTVPELDPIIVNDVETEDFGIYQLRFIKENDLDLNNFTLTFGIIF